MPDFNRIELFLKISSLAIYLILMVRDQRSINTDRKREGGS